MMFNNNKKGYALRLHHLKQALDAAETNQMQIQTEAGEDAASGATATVASTVAVVVAVAAALF